MVELDKTFVAKNKKALLEEISMQLSKARELIDMVCMNPDSLPAAFVGIGTVIGTVDSYFKQYIVLRRGEIPTHAQIGFQAFNDDDEENLESDLRDTEVKDDKGKKNKH